MADNQSGFTPDSITPNGFTLVELAIVLMIIGLLIGGVLRGQELLDNARISGTVQQVKAYEGAVVTFRDTYSAYPGDMRFATNRVPGCNAANNCTDGNGNGIVGNPIAGASGPAEFNTALTAAMTAENSNFWKQLAMAHLITGIDPSATITLATQVFGKSHPSAKIGGGFVVFYSTSDGDFGVGHVLRLQTSPDPSTSLAGKMVISPIKARILDQKMDDGLPNTGDVSGDYLGTGCDNDATNRYLNTEEKSCVMQFSIE